MKQILPGDPDEGRPPARRRYNYRSLSSAYTPAPGFFDELFDAVDRPRGPAAALTATIGRLGSDRLRSAGERRDAIFLQHRGAAQAEHEVKVTMTRL